ncbi:hypothetical protein DYB25_007206 [Aphanomyces astaci]|uniref:RING-type domain-containing protein n=1 Tax=Aphanomyces astaci TaxID=112090 RepID=A0A397BSA6_APHAT|nr:hypothetical protein DYB36_004843 [Aphanomyces astaci]RHY21280.1 hypothetical protein DYB25_007206 [Aphanomyces astaci]RHY39969.1 hypothetical protein DYB30_011210 [Aphanomyces astaci]RHY40973.1 hypothetical protein DYB34_011023 [Aphanomyces astaci]RHZ01851.1 hypothetical protein DYB31_014024 [Aphanomyces astaci]
MDATPTNTSSNDDNQEIPSDHWTTVPTFMPQVQPAALVIKMGFNRVFQYQPVTHYVFSMQCPATHTWWVIRKRYSECDAMRKSLLRLLKTTSRDANLANVTRLLQKVADMSTFPGKHLRDDDDDIRAERLVGLRKFSTLLVAIRLSSMVLAVQTPVPPSLFVYYINHMYHDLSDFLQVPEPQVHQELHHVIGKISPHIPPSVTKPANVQSANEGTTDVICAICLDGVDRGAQEVLELVQCGHTFHKECVGGWLKDHCTCPLCRTMSFDEEFMVEYVTQRVLLKSRHDLLYLLNKARFQFDLFRQQDAAASLSPIPPSHPHHYHHDSLDHHIACAVCMDDLTGRDHHPDTLELECGHAFHRRCIYGWLGDHTTCPICRRLSHYGHLPPTP